MHCVRQTENMSFTVGGPGRRGQNSSAQDMNGATQHSADEMGTG